MGGGWGCGQSSFPTGPRVDAENTGSSWYDVAEKFIEDAQDESGPDATDMKAGDIDVFPVDASTAPDVVPPPEKKVVPWDKMSVDPVSITGELQQLAAGRRQVNGVMEKGCFAVSSHPGQFGKAPQLTLSFVSGQGKVTPLGSLLDAFDKAGQPRFNVNSLFQNKGGNLVLALQSTEGFNPDGSVQQLLVVSEKGVLLDQHDFLLSGQAHYRPQAVVEGETGEQFVLLNNCEPSIDENWRIPCTQDSALAVFATADFSDVPTIIPLGVKNGGAILFDGGQLLIAAAGNVHVDQTSKGKILSLNVQNLGTSWSGNTTIDLPGVGLGGTQIGFSQGRILFTVNNSPWAPENAQPGVVLLGNEQMVSLPLPPKLAFVAGAIFAGNDDVLFSGHSYDAVTDLRATDAYRTPLGETVGAAIPLQSKPLPSQFSIGVSSPYDEFSYCYGAAGTDKSPDGTLYSTVMMVHPN